MIAGHGGWKETNSSKQNVIRLLQCNVFLNLSADWLKAARAMSIECLQHFLAPEDLDQLGSLERLWFGEEALEGLRTRLARARVREQEFMSANDKRALPAENLLGAVSKCKALPPGRINLNNRELTKVEKALAWQRQPKSKRPLPPGLVKLPVTSVHRTR